MSLNLATKASIRRHLGIPAAGTPGLGNTLGLRAVTQAGQLELYMNVLQLEEEAIVLGRPYGSFIIYDPVTVGDTITVIVVLGQPPNQQTVTVPYTIQSGDTATSIAQKLPALLTPPLAGITTQSITDPNAQVSMMSTIGTFVLSLSVMNGGSIGDTNVALVADGSVFPSPKYTVDDGNGDPTLAVIAYGLLPVCDALESQLLNASQNLSFSEVGSRSTGGALFRPDELIVRNSLLHRYRHEMGVMLGFYQPDQVSGIPGFGIQV
jgi:hypothetical protein